MTLPMNTIACLLGGWCRLEELTTPHCARTNKLMSVDVVDIQRTPHHTYNCAGA